MRAFLALLSILFAFPVVQAQSTLEINVTLNNTAGTVYVPGQGEAPASGLSYSFYTNPPHYYLASYTNLLTGLAAPSGNYLVVDSYSGRHTLGVQTSFGSSVFLPVTSGDWNRIENRIDLLETGKFLQEITPSFSFGLGNLYPINVMLKYLTLNLTGSLKKSSGDFRLYIENRGVSGGMPLVEVREA